MWTRSSSDSTVRRATPDEREPTGYSERHGELEELDPHGLHALDEA